RIASEVTDLPLPDSPTSATVLLRGMSNETPLTASKIVPLSIWNETRRLRTLTSGSDIAVPLVISRSHPALELRIERVAQRIGEEREGGDERGHGYGRGHQLPPLAEDQLVLRLVQHRAPRHHVDGNAEAQEREDHLGLDEAYGQDRQLDQHDVAHVR